MSETLESVFGEVFGGDFVPVPGLVVEWTHLRLSSNRQWLNDAVVPPRYLVGIGDGGGGGVRDGVGVGSGGDSGTGTGAGDRCGGGVVVD